MRKLIVSVVILLVTALGITSASAVGSHRVKGYTKKNGTHVEPHMQTNPNGTRNDNYSTRGNVNPYTGKAGTKPGDGQR